MKTLLLLIPFTMMGISNLHAQCTPVDCSADLPVYGGTCDSMLNDGSVNQVYDDFESFVMNNDCFDAGVFDPGLAGTDIKINLVHDITFASLPAGISGVTNQASYSTSAGVNTLGCASFTGTPTEIGVFNGTIDLLVDVTVCGFIPIDLTDQNAQYVMWLTVNPDPTFTGLGSTYCSTDAAVNLNITGTTGGTFSGPGVTGSTFDPAAAGAGMHTIKYLVSAMEGAAIAAASDSMEVVVEVIVPGGDVFADTDADGYGDAANSMAMTGCTIPAGYVANDTDCDDTDASINPGAIEIPGNSIDEDCDGVDGALGIEEGSLSTLNAYPNPTENVLFISGLEGLTNSISVMNSNGQVITSHSNIDSPIYEMNVENLESGIYFVRINQNNNSKVIRFVKQ